MNRPKPNDRRVHARSHNNHEVVRYDRAGKWYVEWIGDYYGTPREALTLDQAAQEARDIHFEGGEVFFDLPGGQRFDARVRELIGIGARRQAEDRRNEVEQDLAAYLTEALKRPPETLNLGELIEILEADLRVYGDRPLILGLGWAHSNRGDYSELSFTPQPGLLLSESLKEAKAAVGKTFTGYKGGEFFMTLRTDVHLAEYGDSGEPIGRTLLTFMLHVPAKGA